MIQIRQIRKIMLSLMEEYTGCTVVPANTTKQMPAYPYISYSLINTDTHKGTYSAIQGVKTVDGVEIPYDVKYMPTKLKYSFTVQSDDDIEAHTLAISVKDFFEEAKRQELADNSIIVSDVGAITPRDNLITIEYEYRKGLDVTLSLNNVIDSADTGTIEKATINDLDFEKE